MWSYKWLVWTKIKANVKDFFFSFDTNFIAAWNRISSYTLHWSLCSQETFQYLHKHEFNFKSHIIVAFGCRFVLPDLREFTAALFSCLEKPSARCSPFAEAFMSRVAVIGTADLCAAVTPIQPLLHLACYTYMKETSRCTWLQLHLHTGHSTSSWSL